jgi:hypothetical protein
MGSRIYNKFIDLVQRWPIDKSRTGKDLGERLRQFVAAEFPHGPISNANEGKLSKDFDSFNRIANNEYRDRFPRKYPGTTVLGLELEEYKFATSNEGLAFINGEYQKRKEEETRED